jgi:hypothetical protein
MGIAVALALTGLFGAGGALSNGASRVGDTLVTYRAIMRISAN